MCETRDPRTFLSSFVYGLSFAFGIGWAIPWFILVGVCIALVVLTPLAPIFMIIGAYPLKRIRERRLWQVQDWVNRDRPLAQEESEPWLQ